MAEPGQVCFKALGFARGRRGSRRRRSLGKRPLFAYANFKLFLMSLNSRPVFFSLLKKILCVPPYPLSLPCFFFFFQAKAPSLGSQTIFPTFSKYNSALPPCLKASSEAPSTTENCVHQIPDALYLCLPLISTGSLSVPHFTQLLTLLDQ